MIKEKRFSPFLKWPGGKEKELNYIHEYLPNDIENYYEPFVGGGAVYLSLDARRYFVNDKSLDLICLYELIKINDKDFFNNLYKIDKCWSDIGKYILNNGSVYKELYKKFKNNHIDLEKLKLEIIDVLDNDAELFSNMIADDLFHEKNVFIQELKRGVFDKYKRMKKIEKQKGMLPNEDIIDNILGSMKSSFYMYIRYLYNKKNIASNKAERTSYFYFIREYCYSGMFRFNKNGDFNVPYGGIAYNKKSFSKKVERMKDENLINHLKTTELYNLDFEEFLDNSKLNDADFIFLDPPYDTEFSTYDKNIFDSNSQKRLANYLLNKCNAKWMLVIKNSDLIFELYSNKDGIDIFSFEKKYLVSFMNRNDKDVQHLVIRNYQ